MNETNIRKYASLMNELGLTGLEITENDTVVRLERNISAPTAAAAVAVQPTTANDNGDFVIRSPMVGIFYAASEENAEPYVSVGDQISEGQTLCIIEAMKLMNEIPAEFGGVITEICVQNGQAVDYGCALFRVRR